MITIKKGLDLPILGTPAQHIDVARPVTHVALLGDDYVGMKPTMLVAAGDTVKLGQPLFTDKKTPGVTFTSPAAGKVVDVIRGAKRKFEAIVIEVNPDAGESEQVTFEVGDLSAFDREKTTELLTESGLWTSLRTRPYGKVPAPGTVPSSIFVQAIDTNPLAACPVVAMADRREEFRIGLSVLTTLTDGVVHVCKQSGAEIPGEAVEGVQVTEFGGPHPAGLVGTHIHELDPVGPHKTVWYLGYQDVIAIGTLFNTGRLDVRRVISLAGPVVGKPRLLETRVGASIDELMAGEYDDAVKIRPISGSVFHGRVAASRTTFWAAITARFRSSKKVMNANSWVGRSLDLTSSARRASLLRQCSPVRSSLSPAPPVAASERWCRWGLTRKSCHSTSCQLSCCEL